MIWKDRINKERITLSGYAGSGKSTVAKILCIKLGYESISVGDFSREFAENEYGLSINEFQDLCNKEPHLDKMIDEKFSQKCNSASGIVVDYRLGFKFIKPSFNVLLKVSDSVAAARIIKENRAKEQMDADCISERNMNMRNRFNKKYGVDFADEMNYHLIIGTDVLKPSEVAEIVITHFREWLKK